MDVNKLLQVKRAPVKSSNIKAIGYNEEEKTLIAEFYSGGVYAYTPITPEGYYSLMRAKSIGSYFYTHVRSNKSIDCKIIATV